MITTAAKPVHVLLLHFLLGAVSSAAAASAHPGYPEAEQCGAVVDMVVNRMEEYDSGRILDITHFYREDMPSWESDEGLGSFLWLAASMKNGSKANNSVMKLPAHSGTHVDAPGHVFQHYFEAGFDVDTLDLHVLNGPALLVDVPRDENITGLKKGGWIIYLNFRNKLVESKRLDVFYRFTISTIYSRYHKHFLLDAAEVMKSLHIPKGVRRVLFRTLNTDRRLMWKKEFDFSYVGFMKDGAQWLVDNTDVKLVG
ncbi:hypothetical protein ZIOFF_030374 [Zingiber officinale]|uniref:Uncharacterized protein n=1 Tax=Zingiber officinale TaxID=94328 RepID=A0A8J5LF61_ZINOF|nr:hypothetical protein ZIOFF_030374 [Zingiber officinale]